MDLQKYALRINLKCAGIYNQLRGAKMGEQNHFTLASFSYDFRTKRKKKHKEIVIHVFALVF